MRCKSVSIVTIGLSIFLCSCAGTTTVENASLLNQPLQAKTSRIKIVRAETFIASLRDARIKMDGREIASLSNGAATVRDIPAGNHEFSVDVWDHPNIFKINVNTKPGMLYTLEVQPRDEAIAAGMFGAAGMVAEAASNPNGGLFQMRVVSETRVAG
jgi:hypothetical protein